MAMLAFAGPALRLTSGDIEAEAAALHCNPAVVLAVRDVESAGAGFLPDGRPTLLFEAHQFYQLTKGRFGTSNISWPSWNRALYGAGGAHQYDRLATASALDRDAALQSASWGMFQVLGVNAQLCGFRDVAAFVEAMISGEHAHLEAFAAFCRGRGIADELQQEPPDFDGFARIYNGPGQVSVYATKLRAAWRKYLANPEAGGNPAPRSRPELYHATLQLNSSGPDVMALQQRLVARGAALAIDGDFGPETMAAVVQFQKSHGLAPDGIVGPRTAAALNQAQA